MLSTVGLENTTLELNVQKHRQFLHSELPLTLSCGGVQSHRKRFNFELAALPKAFLGKSGGNFFFTFQALSAIFLGFFDDSKFFSASEDAVLFHGIV